MPFYDSPFASNVDASLQQIGRYLERTLGAANESIGIGILSDSTANNSSPPDWWYTFATLVAQAYPAYTVKWYLWNDATQDYAVPVVIQTGTAGGGAARNLTYVSASSHANQYVQQNITQPTNLDVAVLAAATNWTPAAVQCLACHWGSAGLRGWRLYINTSGKPVFETSVDGTAIISNVCSVATGVTNGAYKWIRATFQANDGAAHNVVKFYTSDDAVTWAQLGTTITNAGTTTIFDPAVAWEIGGRGNSLDVFDGKISKIQIRNNISYATTATGVNAINSSTLNVGSTTGFPASNGIFILGGVSTTYTGTTGTSFTGCGNHAATTGGEAVTSPPGAIIAPVFADQWEPEDTSSPQPAGAPELAFITGAMPGQGLAYLGYTARIPYLLPDYALRAIVLATSENEANQRDKLLMSQWVTWVTAVIAQAYTAAPIACSQNPRLPGANWVIDHAIRRDMIEALASQRGWAFLDAYQPFSQTGNLPAYIQTDNVHPSVVLYGQGAGAPTAAGASITGASLWATYFYQQLFQGVAP